MRRTTGEKVINVILPAHDGSTFKLDSLRGKRFMLSFCALPPALFATCVCTNW